jgi:malonate decarboxylase epsilon subunit
MSVAFIFPGQGSQAGGMLHKLDDDPIVGQTLDEVSSALHCDVRNLDSGVALESTVSAQIALFAAGVASARSLIKRGISAAAVSGLSIGAFAAAVIAGVLSLEDGVELVRLRAERMTALYPSGYGLSAIVGLTEAQVSTIVRAVTTSEAPVFLGNINAPRQVVIAGANVGMDRALDEARRQGARKAERLHVAVLSHCPLLQPVADALKARISSMTLMTPRMPYVANVNARVMRTAEKVAWDLVNNIAHGVRWYDATMVLQELGCNLFLEMPPRHVLSDLANQNISGVRAIPVEAGALPRILRLAGEEGAGS